MHSPEPVHHVGPVGLRDDLTSEVRDRREIHPDADLIISFCKTLQSSENVIVTSSRRKARNEMTVSICEAPGRAVTQQMAMEADIIIRTVFRIAASVQPENVHIQECRYRKWR